MSRVVTSEGWRPHRQQVGQTGTKISRADYAVIGDLNQVIPALVTALRARSGGDTTTS